MSDAPSPLAHLRQIEQRFFIYSVPDRAAERHWRQCKLCWCLVDALIGEPLLRVHRRDCPVDGLSVLLTDLEAAQQTEKIKVHRRERPEFYVDEEEVARVDGVPGVGPGELPRDTADGSSATLLEVERHIDAARARMNDDVNFADHEYNRGWHDAYHNVRNLLRAGEAVASRSAGGREDALLDDEPLHTGDDERIDLVTGILAAAEDIEGSEDTTDAAASIIESCHRLDVLLLATIKRERQFAALSGRPAEPGTPKA